jgi:RNA polymerase sigma factor FliA
VAWEAPDLEAEIAAHLPLVRSMVRRVVRRLPGNVLPEDLLAAGVIGLYDSLLRNGGAEGEAFRGYLRVRVRGAIFDELRAQDWLPRRERDRVASIALETGAAAGSFVSLDEQLLEEANLAGPGSDPHEALEADCLRRALARAIERLPERERRVVGRHYFDDALLKDIGAELGLSGPRISQLHAQALVRLRLLLDRR